MSVSFIDGRLSTANKLQLQYAAAIVATDGNEEVLIFADAKPGEIIVVELELNQVLLEGPELFELCHVVKLIKGSCLLDLDYLPVVIESNPEPADSVEAPPSESLSSFDDDDDEPANWWKRGAK